MNTEFQKYNRSVSEAFFSLIKTQDLINKKTDNFRSIIENSPSAGKTVLHTGFGPIAVGLKQAGFDVYLTDTTITKFEGLDFKLLDPSKTYDYVIAPDEYFTYASTEEEQKKLIGDLSNFTKTMLVTTLADFKNITGNDKEFSEPQSYRTKDGSVIYLEKHKFISRSSWNTKVYKIDEHDSLSIIGPINRHALFFKQLARFSNDNGASEFLFQKTMMYKGMLKKNYEHVIAIKF